MRMARQPNRPEKRDAYKSPRLTAGQFPANLRAHMERWQMPGAKKGTQWPGKLIVDEFSYSTDIITLPITNGANTVTLLTMQNDAFFEIAKREIAIIAPAAPVGFALPVQITMFDAASGLELLKPTIASNFAGSGGLPLMLGQIKNLAPKQMVGVRFDYIGATYPDTDMTIQATFTGRKVFIRDY